MNKSFCEGYYCAVKFTVLVQVSILYAVLRVAGHLSLVDHHGHHSRHRGLPHCQGTAHNNSGFRDPDSWFRFKNSKGLNKPASVHC